MSSTLLTTVCSLLTIVRPRALGYSIVLLGVAVTAGAQEPLPLSRGQTVYVPVYSEISHGDLGHKGKPASQLLSALVSVRNTDLRHALRVTSARYYDSNGRMLREFVADVRTIPPLGSLDLFIERTETKGGTGASFLIRWQADSPVNPPMVEAIHVNIHSLRPISFSTFGRPVHAPE